jgi:hypothetical protein
MKYEPSFILIVCQSISIVTVYERKDLGVIFVKGQKFLYLSVPLHHIGERKGIPSKGYWEKFFRGKAVGY